MTSIEELANLTYTINVIIGLTTLTGYYKEYNETNFRPYVITKINGQLRISKINASSTTNVPNGSKVGDSTNITGVAVDENENVLANIELKITINGETYNIITNNNDGWSLTYVSINE